MDNFYYYRNLITGRFKPVYVHFAFHQHPRTELRETVYSALLNVGSNMTIIDFYILGHSDEQARFNFACRLCEKAYGEGHQVYVHVENEDQATRLDKLMWQYKAESFLPHNLVTHEQAAQVQIGWQDHPAHHYDVMVNLASPQPNFFSRFARVLEIVIQDEHVLEQTRKHFKFYKDRGYEVTHRDLRG